MLIPLVLSGLVVFLTHSLEAVTGFGCAVLAMPFVTALLGVRRGIVIITILSWLLALYLAASKRKQLDFRQFGIICGCMAIGLPAGMYFFRAFDTIFLKKVLGIFIIVASAWQLLLRLGHRKPAMAEAPRGIKALPYYGLLVVGGIVHGMFSTGGPLVVIYASRALPDKGQFRATLCLLWTALNTVIIGAYLLEGSITPPIAGNTGLLALFVIPGIIAGEKIHHRVNERIFSVIVFSMLLVTGFFMFFL
ncbi:MAG: sulfite exporter TauE/SafE family protein [Spirochaetia bacterium]|jgi:uncharacterized membrane protein YfcA|nr:sulfite exporter TauE/SafE family protein [Spirochaetia bacterium]